MTSADEKLVASLNLKGIKSIDKSASSILHTSKHAALYQLDLSSLLWVCAAGCVSHLVGTHGY